MILVLIFRVDSVTKQIGILRWQLRKLDKTADISRHHLLFLRERTSEERLRKFHTDDFLMTCHYPDLGSPFDWPKQITLAALTIRPIRSTTQRFWVVADTLTVWNFCVRFRHTSFV